MATKSSEKLAVNNLVKPLKYCNFVVACVAENFVEADKFEVPIAGYLVFASDVVEAECAAAEFVAGAVDDVVVVEVEIVALEFVIEAAALVVVAVVEFEIEMMSKKWLAVQ